ncbi:hypothetical protein [Haloterrigena salifodinae]|uniref:hypothetical protein n=1 Tax=Haloterrigena salifodinae TaxID=2675099 RepID=UPI000F86F068|nr:hypothetical protein [Haloterrigena salifodinae]
MPTRLDVVAVACLSGGLLVATLIALSFPELPVSTCTDIGYTGNGPPDGFEFYEFHRGWMGYSPDGGVNRCDTPIVAIAVALLGIGSASLGYDRWRR